MISPHKILGNTVVVTALSCLGSLVNLSSSLVVAYFYGASLDRDAYLLALVVPTYLSSVISGILAVIFIPIFIDHYTRDPRRAWRIASSLVNITGVALILFTIIGFCCPRQLVAMLAPGYGAAQGELTADLLRILLPSVIFTSLSSLFSSLYYAEDRFVLPALAPIAATAVTLLVNVSFNHMLGIKSLAIGSLGGALVSMLMLLPGILRKGRYTFILDLRDEGLNRMLRAAVPLFLASLLYRFNTGFERMFASYLPAGSISFMGYATQITMILSGLTSGGIATTLFPSLSRSWAEKDMVATRKYLAMGIRIILLVSLPIAAGTIVFGSSAVALLLERGAFHHEATLGVTQCLVLLTGSYIFASLGNVVAKGFYVAQRTTLLAAYTVMETIVYLGLAWLLSRTYSFRGLAMAASTRDIISLTLYLFMVRRIFRGINGRELLRDTLKITAAALVLLLAFFLMKHWLATQLPGIALLAVAITVGGALYFILTIHVFRVEDARHLLSKLALRMPFLHSLQGESGT